MQTPPRLTRLIHATLVAHFKRHYQDDFERAELFSEALADCLLGEMTNASAAGAAANLDVQPLLPAFDGSSEEYKMAGILRQTLCREVRQWLVDSGVWRYSSDLKALAFARVVANKVDGGTYSSALQQAKLGVRQVPDDAVSAEEREAMAVEARYAGDWRWR